LNTTTIRVLEDAHPIESVVVLSAIKRADITLWGRLNEVQEIDRRIPTTSLICWQKRASEISMEAEGTTSAMSEFSESYMGIYKRGCLDI
jgi:hypothetical protein